MTIAFALLCLAFAAEPTVPQEPATVTLKSYEQLMKLSDDERADYLGGVREAMLEYEKRMGKYLDELSWNDANPRPWSFLNEAYAADSTEEKKTGQFRCLYAGWAVLGAKCRPETRVKYKIHFAIRIQPDQMMDDTIMTELSCAKGQTLCNPVVYGTTQPMSEPLGGPHPMSAIRPTGGKLADLVRSMVKPVCVTASDRRNVSRECYYKSIDMKAFPDTKYNPEEYERFRTGFDAMCGAAGVTNNPYFKSRPRAAQDMKDTCAWTQARLNQTNPDARRRRSYGPDRDYRPTDRRSNEAESAR